MLLYVISLETKTLLLTCSAELSNIRARTVLINYFSNYLITHSSNKVLVLTCTRVRVFHVFVFSMCRTSVVVGDHRLSVVRLSDFH